MKKYMYIHKLFKHLRTTEGIIRERLKLTDEDWKVAASKYGYLRDPANRARDEKEAAANVFQILMHDT